jgi:hypothetical protein
LSVEELHLSVTLVVVAALAASPVGAEGADLSTEAPQGAVDA